MLAVVLSFTVLPGGERYDFSSAIYHREADRLVLTAFDHPNAAAVPTPEGHIVHRTVPGGTLCGLVLTDVRKRLHDHGRIDVTLARDCSVSLTLEEIARALSSLAGRDGRFARGAAPVPIAA